MTGMRAELHRDDDGWTLPVLRSDRIPGDLRHGFSTRAGGVSAAPFDALNLGGKWGDDPAALAENRRRFARALGVAAAHAGWRGVVAGVLPATVRALAALGARPADLRVALGPAIGPCCFEVGGEVVAAFAAAELAGAVRPSPRGRPDRWHIDLKDAARRQLEGAGVDPAGIDAAADCTSCDRARFYSFRRDGRATGQLMGVIGRP